MKKFYAGIGSRETPEKLRPAIEEIALFLAKEGYTLRSGAAPGADEMFETALTPLLPEDLIKRREVRPSLMEIYVPWYCFQSSTSPLCHVSSEVIEFSLRYHPNPDALKDSVRKIMGRNAYQVLGEDLKTKSDFIVCWIENLDVDTNELYNCGGTGQALRIAKAHGIKIFNLSQRKDFFKWYSDNNFDIM